jgi:hypothetical protein
MILKIKTTQVKVEEVDVQLPLFWVLDNWFSKLEQNIYTTAEGDEVEAFQLTSVSNNCISYTLMTLEQFQAYYGHYRGLYNESTELEFKTEFDKLNNYLR